jgi:hypothetical protein
MMAWENGGNEPVYLCETHADQLGRSDKKREGSLALTARSLANNSVTPGDGQSHTRELVATNPKSFPASGGPPDAQVGEAKTNLSVSAPVRDFSDGGSAKASTNEAVGNVVRENFEAYGTALQGEASAAEGKRSESWDLGRMCKSRNGEPCTADATVHCPTCGAWFCDAHAEDERWHTCVLTI